MNNKISLLPKWLLLMLILPSIAGAQLLMNGAQQLTLQAAPGMATPQAASQNPQAVSQTGLLPMFALDMDFAPTWIDGADVPSKSPQYSHNGVSDTFQQAWDTLKLAGFNMIRFPLKLDDQQSAVRLANLCVWAKANNVSLIPVLKVAATELKTQSSLANATSALVTAVVAGLHQAGDAQFATYTQIAYYQIEGTLNHTGHYPGLTPDVAQQALSNASSALRAAESQALQGTGVQATPILITASFDFELIRQGGINGVPLDPGAEQKAQASLNQFLAPFASAQNIDAINVEWFPGSISSGDASHFASLLRTLKGALPGKQLTLTTGSSSAFNPATTQVQFYTLAVSNLGDFRASDGVNSSFLGAVFRQAFNSAQANANPPAGTDPSKWDWNAKAQQLAAMWSQGTKADDLAWWVSKVQGNMGLLALQPNATGGATVTPLPSVSAFQQISATVSQVSQNVVPPPTAPGAMAPTPPSTGTGMPQAGMPGYPAGTQAASQGYGSANGTSQGGYSAYATGFQTSPQSYGVVNGMSQAGNPTCAGGMQTLPQGYGMQTSPQGYGMVNGTANAMPPSVAPSCLGGMTTGAPNGSAAFQQMMFTILQQFTTQMAGAFVTKLSTPSVHGTQLGGYPATNLTSSSAGQSTAYGASTPGSQSVTTPSVSSPAVPQTPATSSSSANTVSLGPQDVTVDKGTIAVGQAVHFTAQVHNVTANQDLSGLTVALADPSGVLTNLPTQSGVLVPHASATPVSIPWAPAQSGATPYQLSVQVLDGSGNQIASATAPAITVNGSTAASGANTGTGSTGGSGSTSSSGNSSTGTQPSSGTPASSSPVQPQITFFGIANASAATPAGQIPTLLVQVSNPSPNSMQPAKATLSVDGSAGQTQNIGTLLPQQTRSALFSGVSAATGSHAVQVSVTTADGGSASATANVSAAVQGTPTAGSSSGGGTTLPLSGPAVRYGTPTTFQIGAFSQSIAAIPSSGNQFQSQGPSPAVGTANGTTASATTASATAAAGSNLGSRSGTVRNATGAPGSSSANNLPVRPGQPGASSSTTSPSTSGPVRNITQGTTSSSTPATTPANGGGFVRPGPSGMATNALPSTISRPGGPAPVAEGGIDLSVSMPDIRFTPASPRPGQATTFSALIRNLGAVAVQGAQVSFRLIVDGRQAAISQPLVFNISGQGTFLASWSTLIPPGQQMQVVVAVTANGDVNPANNQAALTFNVGIPGAPARQ